MSDTGFTLTINPDEFTIGDLEDFEDVAGMSFGAAVKSTPALDDEGNKTFDEKGRPLTETNIAAKSLKALVWIVKRHDIPGFTVEDARAVKINALEIVESEADPKDLTV